MRTSTLLLLLTGLASVSLAGYQGNIFAVRVVVHGFMYTFVQTRQHVCECVCACIAACMSCVCVWCVCMCTCQCFLVHFSKEATTAKCIVLVQPAMVTGMTLTATTWLMHTAELFNCTTSGNMTYISSSLQPDFNNTHTLYVKSCKG